MTRYGGARRLLRSLVGFLVLLTLSENHGDDVDDQDVHQHADSDERGEQGQGLSEGLIGGYQHRPGETTSKFGRIGPRSGAARTGRGRPRTVCGAHSTLLVGLLGTLCRKGRGPGAVRRGRRIRRAAALHEELSVGWAWTSYGGCAVSFVGLVIVAASAKAQAAEQARQAQQAAQAAEVAIRQGLETSLQDAITKDAKQSANQGLLQSAPTSTTCTPVSGGSSQNLAESTGTYSCIAAYQTNSDGTSSGYRYTGTINFTTGMTSWHLGG